MGNQVYANNMEISCKAAGGKSMAAFPDVCFTPPQTPATPPGVPIPYPNTGMASDCTDGSSTVRISGQEVMLKDKSYFKRSMGDEAGCAPKKGVITSKNMGKVYFKSWSMDVKVEGENVVRHMDLTTHNHASEPPQTPPWMHVDEMAPDVRAACADEIDDAEVACNGVPGPHACTDPCREAQRCILYRHEDAGSRCCEPDTTGDHVVESNCFVETGGRGGLSQQTDLSAGELQALLPGTTATAPRPFSQFDGYHPRRAPTICASQFEGNTNHGGMQALRDHLKRAHIRGRQNDGLGSVPIDDKESWWTYDEAAQAGATAVHIMYPGCSEECIKAQLDKYHVEEAGIDPDDDVVTEVGRPDSTPGAPQNPSEQYLQTQGLMAAVKRAFWGIVTGA